MSKLPPVLGSKPSPAQEINPPCGKFKVLNALLTLTFTPGAVGSIKKLAALAVLAVIPVSAEPLPRK